MPFFPASQFFGFFPNLDTNKFTTPYIETLITLVTTEFDLQTKNIFAPTFTNVTEADCFNFLIDKVLTLILSILSLGKKLACR